MPTVVGIRFNKKVIQPFITDVLRWKHYLDFVMHYKRCFYRNIRDICIYFQQFQNNEKTRG